MNRVFLTSLFLFGFLLGFNSQAQSVAPLFPSSGYLTNVAVPFEVTGRLGANDSINIVSLVPIANTGNCKNIVDVYRPQIFHVRCTRAGSVIYKISYLRNGVLEAMTLPSITMTAPNGTVVDPDPGDGGGGGDPGEDPDIGAGQTLFSAHCLGCHSANSMRGRSVGQITNAINSQSQMSGLKSLSTADRTKISKFLGSL